MILIPQNHSPSLPTHNLSRNTLWPYWFTHFTITEKRTITRIRKEQITPGFTGITELLRSDIEPIHNYLAILQNFDLNLFSKTVSISLSCVYLLFFEIQREAIFIALKTSRFRQLIMSQNSFNPTENWFNRFLKSCYNMWESTGWNVVLTGWIG